MITRPSWLDQTHFFVLGLSPPRSDLLRVNLLFLNGDFAQLAEAVSGGAVTFVAFERGDDLVVFAAGTRRIAAGR